MPCQRGECGRRGAARRGVGFRVAQSRFYRCPRMDQVQWSLLHFLFEKAVVPRVLVIVLDNAAVNKGEPIMAWLAFIMMKTGIEEIHLYYPTKGHTHTTLDAHFGRVKPKDAYKQIRTPQELKRHLDSLPLTRAVLDFALYEIQAQLCPLTVAYKNRMSQHNFVLHKNDKGEVLFKYSPLLRFADHMTERVRTTLLGHSYFMSMTDEERNNGIPVFRMDDGATVARLDEIAAQCSPSPCGISLKTILELAAQIPPIRCRQDGEELSTEMAALTNIAVAKHGLNLGEILDKIKSKAAPRSAVTADAMVGREGVEDLMRRVVVTGSRQHLKADMQPGNDLAHVRETEIFRILGILKGRVPNVEEKFAVAASKHSNGRMAPGYKAIVDKIRKGQGRGAGGMQLAAAPSSSAARSTPVRSPAATPSFTSPLPMAASSNGRIAPGYKALVDKMAASSSSRKRSTPVPSGASTPYFLSPLQWSPQPSATVRSSPVRRRASASSFWSPVKMAASSSSTTRVPSELTTVVTRARARVSGSPSPLAIAPRPLGESPLASRREDTEMTEEDVKRADERGSSPEL